MLGKLSQQKRAKKLIIVTGRGNQFDAAAKGKKAALKQRISGLYAINVQHSTVSYYQKTDYQVFGTNSARPLIYRVHLRVAHADKAAAEVDFFGK